MDVRLQKILEQRYDVVWLDTSEYEELNKSATEIQDPFLKKKFASYLVNDDPLYYTFNYSPLIDVAMTKPNPNNLFQNHGNEKIINGHTVLEISPDEYFFKGMKTFYRTEFAESGGPKWFGKESIAFKYAKRYHGGINVYKPKRTVKLLVYTNYDNLKKIINYYETHNKKYVFPIKIKTGVEISIFAQIDYYLKYNKFDSIWLSRKPIISPTSGQQVPVIPKLYLWGRGKIDRDVAEAVCNYCLEHNFDGYISYEHYTPFMLFGSEEIVLCDYRNVLDRAYEHPLDWLSWEPYLPIKIEKNFLLEESYSNKNNNFQIIKFWNDNKMNSALNKKLHLYIKKLKNKFVLSTLNVHSFYSVNHYLNAINSFDKMLLYLKNFEVDLLCLEEFAIHHNLILDQMKEKLAAMQYNLNYIKTETNFGNAIISKYPIDIIDDITLTNHPSFRVRRKATFFKINNEIVANKIFCLAHLEIGKRYTNRQGSLLPEDELREVLEFNSNVRITQLKQIIEKNPDIILGDFNFNPDDKEFEYMTPKYRAHIQKIPYTTPFNTIVDYVFYKKNTTRPIISLAPNYRYSDHLPVLNVLAK